MTSGATDTLEVPLSPVGCRGLLLSVKGVWPCERELGPGLTQEALGGGSQWAQRPLHPRPCPPLRRKASSA